MAGRILYKSSVRHDLKHISRPDQERVLRKIGEILVTNPRSGEPLRGDFEGLLKLRVGEYRVIYALIGGDVLVLRIRHRSKAYD